jgi:hypothetical protein
MNKLASVTALGAVAALTVAWFWVRPNEQATPALSNRHVAEPRVSAGDTTSGGVATGAVENNATEPEPEPRDSPVAPQDERVARAAQELADAFDRGVAPSFVDYLASKGLSREDSERIVADGVREMATCVLDAMREQAAAQAVPLEDVLDGIKAGDPPVALPRLFFSERVGSCINGVQQRIGLPAAVTYELSVRGSTFELGAQVVAE